MVLMFPAAMGTRPGKPHRCIKGFAAAGIGDDAPVFDDDKVRTFKCLAEVGTNKQKSDGYTRFGHEADPFTYPIHICATQYNLLWKKHPAFGCRPSFVCCRLKSRRAKERSVIRPLVSSGSALEKSTLLIVVFFK
jgi:hypothetical protein